MRAMEENKARKEDKQETSDMKIKQFIEAARQYLFPMVTPQAALATIPVRNDRYWLSWITCPSASHSAFSSVSRVLTG